MSLPPLSAAAEEFLDELARAAGVEAASPAAVASWLSALLENPSQALGVAGDAAQLETLRTMVEEKKIGGGQSKLLTKLELVVRAGERARECGRPVVSSDDVAWAVLAVAADGPTSTGDAISPGAVVAERSIPASMAAEEMLAELAPGLRGVAEQVRAAAADEAREAGRPIITPRDVSAAIARINAEDVLAAGPESDLETVPEPGPPTVPSLEPGRARTFRLFVSSTFRDLQAERNALQERAFPRLKAFCTSHGARFQAIDLRWGVSEEAAVDQQTMNICLGEIDRCDQVTPRPNFLVLLGNRYGWLPPPPQIPATEFERILDRVEVSEDRRCLEFWYRKDLNADPPEYRLQPRAAERENYRDPDAWGPEEDRILHALRSVVGVEGLDLPPARLKVYHASATEQEVLAGALDVAGSPEKVFCFFRDIRGHPEDGDGNPTQDAAAFVSAEPDARARLRSLKERLDARLPETSTLKREVAWKDGNPECTEEYLTDLVEWVAASLERAILNELGRPSPGPESQEHMAGLAPFAEEPTLYAEVREHLDFAAERRRFFVGREDVLADIAQHVAGMNRPPLAAVGEGGTGKSALMAEVGHRTLDTEPDAVVVVRFIGATPGSSDGRHLLDGLCREIAIRYGHDSGEMPAEYQDLVPKLAGLLEWAEPRRPLILIVDSLDQLTEPAQGLAWIPLPLPDHVRLLVSTRPGKVQDRLEARGAEFVELGPLSRRDGGLLLQAWLGAAKPPRRLQPSQVESVLDAFVAAEGNPLYLKLATEESRRWPAWAEGRTESVSDAPIEPLGRGVRGIIQENLLDRLADEDNHGSELVSHAVAYLAASRHGLAEDELVELLSSDPDVYSWFVLGAEHFPHDLVERAARYWFPEEPDRGSRAPASPRRKADVIRRLRLLREDPQRLRIFLTDELGPGGLQLPVVLWSRLFFDLEPHLTEHRAEGGDLLAFYHRELADVAAERFLIDGAREELHGRLADYFRSKADPDGDQRWMGEGTRGLSELPFHLTRAERWTDVYGALTDFGFLEQKAARVGVMERTAHNGEERTLYTGVFHLQDDLERVLQVMPGGERPERGRHPLIVTAVGSEKGLAVHCPWCGTEHPLNPDWLGEDIVCPTGTCIGPLRVNPFTVGGASEDEQRQYPD